MTKKEYEQFSVFIPDTLSIDETREFVLKHYYHDVIASAVEKALSSADNVATKFVVEFAESAPSLQHKESMQTSAWEASALALRDELGVELSAETLVKLLCEKLSAKEVKNILTRTDP